MISSIRHLATLLLLAICCHATNVVVVITPQAIFIGADGKSTNPETSGSRPVDKAVIFQKRLIVACLGVASFGVPSNGVNKRFSFYFTQWIKEVEKHAPPNLTVADLTSLLETEGSVTFNDMDIDRFITDGALDFQYPACVDLNDVRRPQHPLPLNTKKR
jgi:hypothetical protein